jgi:hypothetical protein
MAKGVTLLAGYHDITTGISAGIMSYIRRGVAWQLMRRVSALIRFAQLHREVVI